LTDYSTYTDAVFSVGNDGSWSTIKVRVGNPEQYVDSLISTAGQETWVIDPSGCNIEDPPQCPNIRGNTFVHNKSTTWQEVGLFELGLEANLNYTGNGDYGFDQVGLGFDDTDSPKLNHQVVASVADKDFFLGQFGIGPNPVNFTNSSDPQPSFFSSLRANKSIPSLSWAYTAGAHYSEFWSLSCVNRPINLSLLLIV
jgi:hypothetical protein